MDYVVELFNSLESNNPQEAEDAKKQFHEHFNATKESWLLSGIFDYYISTGSLRAVDIIVGVREPHERYFFDRIFESLRGSLKLQALTLLGHVVRKHPAWLYKIANHPLLKELLKLLKTEKEVLSLMNALLIVIILLPIIAGLFAPHLSDLLQAFSHLASWNTNNPNKVPEGHLLHLQIGLYVLFNRLYGMYPCTFLAYLRQEYTIKQNIPIFTHTIKPMLDTVKMHPLLVTASPDIETSAARWKKMEANDIIMECANFSVESTEKSREECWFRNRGTSFRVKAPPKDYAAAMLEATRRSSTSMSGSQPSVSSYCSAIPADCEIWSPTIYTGASTPPPQESTSIPHTPITQNCLVLSPVGTYIPQEGNSPPEAAIEATPESTPVKDLRQTQVVRPSSTVARSLTSFVATSVQDGSYQTKETFPQHSSGQAVSRAHSDSAVTNNPRSVQRVIVDRIQMEKDVDVSTSKAKLSGGYTPGSPLRVIQSAPSTSDKNTGFSSPHLPERSDEDREVECTLIASSTTAATMTRGNDSAVASDVRRSSSERDFLDETNDPRGCSRGGLHMPDSNSMAQFTTRVQRLRYHSQCQQSEKPFHLAQIGVSTGSSPNEGGLFPETATVRRAVSCPEMKKDSTVISQEVAPTLEEADEDTDKEASKEKMSEIEVTSCSTQTDEPQPYDYEHLFLSVFPPWDQVQQRSAPPDVSKPPHFGVPSFSPRAALESYIEVTVRNLNDRRNKPNEASELKNLRDQLSLLMLQLQFERHRREVHAERNRRLLGKSRYKRALEEHNSALRDQVALLQNEIESLRKELERSKREAKNNSNELQKNLNYWQEQSTVLERKYKEAEGQISFLQETLKEEERRTATIAREYTCSQGKMFELENTLKGLEAAAHAGRETRNELAMLKLRLTCAGEIEHSLRAKIDALSLRAQEQVDISVFSKQYSEMQKALSAKECDVEAALQRIEDLKAQIRNHEEIREKLDDLMQKIRDECDRQIEEERQVSQRLRELNVESEVKILNLHAQMEMMERRMAKMKNMTSAAVSSLPQVRDSAVGGSPPLSTSLSSGGSPQMQNLQLLVDTTASTSTAHDSEDAPL
ncbi:hypothetical protein O3M35_002893 [Rhynocoris fuscipes]|uniref:Hamartin n=1 Tax=Rhynocoris fuscipes TaxID=488301 RepID=A0AAW1CUQ6_9HEMI